MPRSAGAVLSAASLLVSTACQVYTPVQLSPRLADKDVRVTLTQIGATDLASTLGSPAESVEGHLVSASDSALVIQMKSLTRLNGVEDSWNGESVRIPGNDVSRVETSRLSTARSGILAALVIGATYLAGRSFIKGHGEATPSHGQLPGGAQ